MTPAAAQERELILRYRRDGDAGAREALVTRYLPLARHLAGRYRGLGELDDLHQVAAVALMKAIDRFDVERGPAFSSFAVPTILGELKRHFRDRGWMVRVPRDLQELKLRIDHLTHDLTGELGRSPTTAELANRASASVEDVLEALTAGSARYPDSLDQPMSEDGDSALDLLPASDDGAFERVENAMVIDGLLARLPERERLILRLRFEHELTQIEIGERLGIPQMHVSRLIRAAIATLQGTTTPDRVGVLRPRRAPPVADRHPPTALEDLLMPAMTRGDQHPLS
jgi:RNA polymerase sigma-B factor